MWTFHHKHYAADLPAFANGLVWAGIWSRWAVKAAMATVSQNGGGPPRQDVPTRPPGSYPPGVVPAGQLPAGHVSSDRVGAGAVPAGRYPPGSS